MSLCDGPAVLPLSTMPPRVEGAKGGSIATAMSRSLEDAGL